MIVQHLKQIGKVKKHNKWVPHELPEKQKKKNHRFEVLSSFILYNSNKSFLDWIVMCDKKWILYDNRQWPAQWLDQEEAPNHLPKPNMHQRKVLVTIWWFAAGLIHYSFLNPSKTITSEKYAQLINEMHWKLQCLQLALVNRMGTILLQDNAWLQSMSHKNTSKVEQIGPQLLTHLPFSPNL